MKYVHTYIVTTAEARLLNQNIPQSHEQPSYAMNTETGKPVEIAEYLQVLAKKRADLKQKVTDLHEKCIAKTRDGGAKPAVQQRWRDIGQKAKEAFDMLNNQIETNQRSWEDGIQQIETVLQSYENVYAHEDANAQTHALNDRMFAMTARIDQINATTMPEALKTQLRVVRGKVEVDYNRFIEDFNQARGQLTAEQRSNRVQQLNGKLDRFDAQIDALRSAGLAFAQIEDKIRMSHIPEAYAALDTLNAALDKLDPAVADEKNIINEIGIVGGKLMEDTANQMRYGLALDGKGKVVLYTTQQYQDILDKLKSPFKIASGAAKEVVTGVQSQPRENSAALAKIERDFAVIGDTIRNRRTNYPNVPASAEQDSTVQRTLIQPLNNALKEFLGRPRAAVPVMTQEIRSSDGRSYTLSYEQTSNQIVLIDRTKQEALLRYPALKQSAEQLANTMETAMVQNLSNVDDDVIDEYLKGIVSYRDQLRQLIDAGKKALLENDTSANLTMFEHRLEQAESAYDRIKAEHEERNPYQARVQT